MRGRLTQHYTWRELVALQMWPGLRRIKRIGNGNDPMLIEAVH
jgi:hypothetical protein